MHRLAADVPTTLNMIPPREESSRPHRTTYEPDYVRGLFDSIARRYDLLNHVLSSGIDILWRRRVVDILKPLAPRELLDVATGTGDLAIACAALNPRRIVGVDVSPAMMEIGSSKVRRQGLSRLISFERGAAEQLPFPAGSFDAATVAFGVRNFSNLDRGLREIHRVLKPGGAFVVLEFSKPKNAAVQAFYGFYSARILPFIGGIISGSREAYSYLPATIREFPSGGEFALVLRSNGFHSVTIFPQTFGIASIYHATR